MNEFIKQFMQILEYLLQNNFKEMSKHLKHWFYLSNNYLKYIKLKIVRYFDKPYISIFILLNLHYF